jgi:glycosyl transferase family 2
MSSELSVVIASVNGMPHLARCLDALQRNASGAEVVLADATDEETRGRVREEWPRVRLLPHDGPATVPQLRAAGIAAASNELVAVIEDHCLVREGWAERIVDWHRQGHAAVGGPVHNAVDRRIRDWAAFFCEYSAFMEPLPLGPARDLPGMNVSYDRRAIEAVQDLLDEGRWETWLHARLRERGLDLWCDPELVIDHDKDFGIGEFLSQRYHYSRAYAGMRVPGLGSRRWVYAVGAPLLPPLLYLRIARNVARTRHRAAFAAATPLVLLDLAVWAVGEMVGYVAGEGDSLQKVR